MCLRIKMVRTKADGASGSSRKAVGGSAPRKALGGASTSSASSSPSGKANKYAGGNAYCPRPTPDWQKGISGFLSPGRSKDKENTEPNNDVEIVGEEDNCQAGTSSSSSESSSSQGSSKSSSDDD